MVMRPSDIPRPGVARDRGVSARPSTVQLTRVENPQAAAISDEAQATRRKASEIDRLAARKRAAGREQAAALEDQARVQSESARQLAFAQDQFSKTLGGIAQTFELIEGRRKEADDNAFLDRWELEAAKEGATVESEHLNSPREGSAYIEELDGKLSETYEQVTERVKAELGYEPSDDAKAKLTSRGFDLRTGAARRSAVAANNARVARLVELAENNVIEIAREVAGTGELDAGITRVNQTASTLESVLEPSKLEAFKRAANQQVYEMAIRGHLARGEVDVAEAMVGQLVGFEGDNAKANHRYIIDAFRAEGVDPLLGLAISRFETSGTFSTKIRPTDKRGKRLSSAAGLFQMTSATARAYLGTTDAAEVTGSVQAAGGARFTADHVRGLRRALGDEPTPGEVYLAHLLGFGRAVRVIDADPDTPLSKLLPKNVIDANKGLMKGTAGDLQAKAQGLMQDNMQAILDSGIMQGRDLARNEAGLPIDSSVRLYALVEQQKRALAQDPDIAAARREIAKTGYDMLMDDKMDVRWLEANRDLLTVSDYKAFLRGLQPGTKTRKMEPQEYLRLFDLADNDPETAMDQLRDMYGQDQIAKDDFKGLFSRAQRNSAAGRARPYTTEIRDYIRKQLAPGARDPKSAYARQLDAIWQFEDWVEANPGAPREEIRKQGQVIVDDFRQIRYATGVTELPAPRFIAVPREQINMSELAKSKTKVIEELRAGRFTEREAAQQAAILRRWEDLLRFRDRR